MAKGTDSKLKDFDLPKYPYTLTRVWGGSPKDEGLAGGENALEKGVTSTHVANTLYTTSEASFLAAKTAKVPCSKFTDDNGTTVYEIHFSFGPNNNKNDPLGGMLDPSYLVNCLNAQLLTPAPDNLPMTTDPIKTNAVNSNLDFLKLFTTQIKLSPLLTLKQDDKAKAIPIHAANQDSIDDFKKSINSSLDEYLKSEKNDESRSDYFDKVNKAFITLKASMGAHDNTIKNMTQNQFLHYFNENIGEVGLEPKTTVLTHLISEAEIKEAKKADKKVFGFEEGKYIKEMVRIKNAMDGNGKLGFVGKALFSYNFIFYNCAHAVRSLYLRSANDSRISDKLEHTIGWNDIKKNGIFSIKNLLAIPVLVFGRALESPVNFVYNLPFANRESQRLNDNDNDNVTAKNSSQLRPSSFSGHQSEQHMENTSPSLPARVIGSPTMRHRLSLMFSPRAAVEDNYLKDLAKTAKNEFVIKAINTDENNISYIFYNKDLEIARDFYNKDYKLINFEFVSPLELQQSGKLLREIKDNIPEAKNAKMSFKITAGNDQENEAHALKDLVEAAFKESEVKIEFHKEATKLKSK